jgi:hypothetical protein
MFIRDYNKIKALPEGHIDKRKLEKVFDKEYGSCREVERKWAKRLNPRFFSAQQALTFCNQICDQLGEQKLRKVVLNSPDVKDYAGGHYCNREIHFKYDWITFTSLMHELTHHFGEYSHGKSFCDMENFLFKVAYTHVTGKQPKKDW